MVLGPVLSWQRIFSDSIKPWLKKQPLAFSVGKIILASNFRNNSYGSNFTLLILKLVLRIRLFIRFEPIPSQRGLCLTHAMEQKNESTKKQRDVA
jgi:hypothetical protein